MAKLPYTFTICPPDDAPKQFTASCPQLVKLLMNSTNGDLTIDDRRNGLWQSWERGGIQYSPIEERIHDLVQKDRK